MPFPAPDRLPLSAVDRFRARTSRLRIHSLEQALLWLVCAHLVFLAWALGGRQLWSQWISLGLGLAAFGLALIPREYDESTGGMAPFRLYTWPRLIRFPVFWLGLSFLGYLVVQGINPAWTYLTDGKVWWIAARSHVTWLPAGMDTPFAVAGVWRNLLLYAPAWLVVCAVWIGFTRRRTLERFFTILACHAAALALFGLVQRGLGATRIFWSFQPPAAYFVASFTYKNQAGAYFDLLLGVCAGLAVWHYVRSQRRLEKSSPAGLFSFFALVVATLVLFSYSRTATLLLAIFIVLFSVYFFLRLRAEPAELRNSGVLLSTFVIIFGFAALSAYSLKFHHVVDRLDNAIEQFEAHGTAERAVMRSATLAMAGDRLATGWGAGCFRFAFPLYQRNYPEVWGENGRRLYWEHAHNDYAEFLAENGLVGCLPLLAILGFFLLRLTRSCFWQNPLSASVVLGAVLPMAHAWLDFPFANPAILLTWCVLWPAIARWTDLEEAHTPP